MGVQLLLLKEQTKKNLIRFWYWLMKPIARLVTSFEKKQREREKELVIPEDLHVKRMAKCIIRYLVKEHSRTHQVAELEYIISGKVISDERFYWAEHLGRRNHSILTGKALKHFYKFTYTIDFQMKVIEELQKEKRIQVKEVDLKSELTPYQFNDIQEYHKAFRVSFGEEK